MAVRMAWSLAVPTADELVARWAGSRAGSKVGSMDDK